MGALGLACLRLYATKEKSCHQNSVSKALHIKQRFLKYVLNNRMQILLPCIALKTRNDFNVFKNFIIFKFFF